MIFEADESVDIDCQNKIHNKVKDSQGELCSNPHIVKCKYLVTFFICM